MSIKTTALILAIAATVVTTPVLIVLAPQLAYAQQGPSTNSNFQEWVDSTPPKYRVMIPTNWKGPTQDEYGDITFQSPDRSQSVQIARRLPGFNIIHDWVNAEIQDLASKGKRPDQDLPNRPWGIHSARILMYPDRISVWIEAYTRFYNIRAEGAVINGPAINPTVLQILNSFRIDVPNPQEFRQIGIENHNFNCRISWSQGIPCTLLDQSTTRSNNDAQVLQTPLPNSNSQQQPPPPQPPQQQQQPPEALSQTVETQRNTPVDITLQIKTQSDIWGVIIPKGPSN